MAWTRWTFVSKVTCLLSNILCRFVLALLPRSNRLLISWLQSLSVVIWEHKKIKSVTVSTFYPSFCHEVMEPDAMILVFFDLLIIITHVSILFVPHHFIINMLLLHYKDAGFAILEKYIDS